ncbi:phospho-sugar mutase [Natribacillus halophilus]|uniref:Phosphoglucomutase n=1 Tax=Natribacillus halophilus TaxID=549003 RepID=A0A1G8NUH4_9BACI|nr:phospho-sugar mutase [Natribacillus halophilus]SDI83847.1 alpha-phosphoglucomutase [Natribacillus halophilus]
MDRVVERWREGLRADPRLSAQLEEMIQNQDETQLEDCFYRSLTFGTGGMRGQLGPGPNRMNRYTVRKAALGLARYLKATAGEGRVVIAFDSRRHSDLFAQEAALTLAHEGIAVDLFPSLRPTPLLSFAVRAREANAGIMITASHNPAEYNGLKVYDENGGQLTPEPAGVLIEYVEAIEDELTIPVAAENELVQTLPASIDDRYEEALASVLEQPRLGEDYGDELQLVFSPLHGTALEPLKKAFNRNGYTNVHIVAEQARPDPDFSTVTKPNPEEAEAFAWAKRWGREKQADVLIATDPDADRLGVAVPDERADDGYRLLTGNETGFLLLDYLLAQRSDKNELPANGKVLKTIVTSESGRQLARHYGVDCEDTLTGFKYIAEKMQHFEDGVEDGTFLFGYEESYGYLLGSFVRDKDALQAALVVAEIALAEKRAGRSLTDRLERLYQTFGYFREDIESLTLKGKEGEEEISSLLASLREEPPHAFGDEYRVTMIEDYHRGEAIDVESGQRSPLNLPASNVIKYKCADDSWVCVRPSGTEPKVKCYFGVKKRDQSTATQSLTHLQEAVMADINRRLTKSHT